MKDFFRRLAKFLIFGIPHVDIRANITQINYNSMFVDRKILITGGDGGIGFSIAKKCCKEGAKVVIVGRNEEKLRIAKEELGENAQILKWDVLDVESMHELYDEAERLVGSPIDSLVNNAGISLHEGNITNVSLSNYEKQMNINLRGAYFLSKIFVERRDKTKTNNILFITSERGLQADDLPYGISKAGINQLTRGLSRRFYKSGICVNAIAPGVTTSELTGIQKTDNLYLETAHSERVFLAEEIAEVAYFLLSDASNCVSGEIIACDAGNYLSAYY